MLKTKSVAIVAKKGAKIILIKRSDNGAWELPGGRIEENETILEAAVREFREETGLTMLRKKHIANWLFPDKRCVAVIRCQFKGRKKLSEETQEISLLDSKETTEYTKALLEDLRKGNFEIKARGYSLKTVLKYLIKIWGVV